MREHANVNEPNVDSRMVQEVLNTEHALDEALLKTDLAALDTLLAQEVTRTSPTGTSPDRVPLYGILMDELSRRLREQRDVLYQPSALADADLLEQLLVAAGLKAVHVIEETRVHRFLSFDEYWHPFEAGGTARAAVHETVGSSSPGSSRCCARAHGTILRGRVPGGRTDVFFGIGER